MAVVGASVGMDVGGAVGLAVGTTVGTIVGMGVGGAVGLAVGDRRHDRRYGRRRRRSTARSSVWTSGRRRPSARSSVRTSEGRWAWPLARSTAQPSVWMLASTWASTTAAAKEAGSATASGLAVVGDSAVVRRRRAEGPELDAAVVVPVARDRARARGHVRDQGRGHDRIARKRAVRLGLVAPGLAVHPHRDGHRARDDLRVAPDAREALAEALDRGAAVHVHRQAVEPHQIGAVHVHRAVDARRALVDLLFRLELRHGRQAPPPEVEPVGVGVANVGVDDDGAAVVAAVGGDVGSAVDSVAGWRRSPSFWSRKRCCSTVLRRRRRVPRSQERSGPWRRP